MDIFTIQHKPPLTYFRHVRTKTHKKKKKKIIIRPQSISFSHSINFLRQSPPRLRLLPIKQFKVQSTHGSLDLFIQWYISYLSWMSHNPSNCVSITEICMFTLNHNPGNLMPFLFLYPLIVHMSWVPIYS